MRRRNRRRLIHARSCHGDGGSGRHGGGGQHWPEGVEGCHLLSRHTRQGGKARHRCEGVGRWVGILVLLVLLILLVLLELLQLLVLLVVFSVVSRERQRRRNTRAHPHRRGKSKENHIDMHIQTHIPLDRKRNTKDTFAHRHTDTDHPIVNQY